jgi:hypothetical protein
MFECTAVGGEMISLTLPLKLDGNAVTLSLLRSSAKRIDERGLVKIFAELIMTT